MAEHEYTSQ